MVHRGLESEPGAQRARFLGTAHQNEAQFLKVSEGNLALLTGAGLAGVPGKKKSRGNSSKTLTMGKHFCDKERARPYEKANAEKIPERLHLEFEISAVSVFKPQEGPVQPQQALLVHPPRVGLLPASISRLAGAGICFPDHVD